jgi:GTP pyrophosphokinase
MRQELQRGDAPFPSTNQIDQLGARLRDDDYAEDDLRMLDRLRRSYASAYEQTVKAIQEILRLAPTGRPAKSTNAICDKLNRSSMRLSQMQDVAGCRLIVEDRRQQDELVAQLTGLFPGSTVVDRRIKSSHGYRAVHVIVRIEEKAVEVQVRTEPQHAWAEYAEKLADTIDPALKYGGGPEGSRAILNALSNVAHFVEQIELDGTGQHHQFAAALAEVARKLADLHRG